ncbi:hypothetical protein [Aureibacter tunicatorum]|uniref:Uncharacterized protein n=1 Tax=Aureibacter tunicatorum TaxID=866807 RepID=A0AAE3XST7_9BACT|nr:hypothetical protein [Aureibacter tunicatorum]MDR6240949.1 hypothetical protein [Aureibacter tunicatorum]BDD03729.1 hypothetical protein AUTU_12120 [Aureibacter tunicatorum]
MSKINNLEPEQLDSIQEMFNADGLLVLALDATSYEGEKCSTQLYSNIPIESRIMMLKMALELEKKSLRELTNFSAN